MTSTYANWGPSRVKLTWIPSLQPPDRELITSAHGLCFHDEKMLLVDIKNRGWNFPGGHVEFSESAIDCLKREVMEEACVEGDCLYLGYVEVNHSENPVWTSDTLYPLIGYQAFYRMDVTRILPFQAIHESAQRMFIHPCEVSQHTGDWHDVYEAILDSASAVIKSV